MSTASTKTYHKYKAAGLCPKCGNPSITDMVKCDSCRTRDNAMQIQHMRRIKDEAFNAYGGYICKCCGNTDPDVLTLDHTNGGGEQHRKQLSKNGRGNGAGTATYRWLRQQGYPEGFQVLCLNCNRKKFMVALRSKEISIYQFVSKEAV